MIRDSDKITLKQLGGRIKVLRLAKKLTFRKMALRCNVDFSDIQKIESGKVNITVITLIELAKALEVEPMELLNFNES
ncbi:helix-turn-helix domain-containing protein [Mucilaginibacter paludis]|uniref:Helix-turn-helix domain protein n=1 Tax=Mucilaginibacter paludis DSM 18603 TaxID=714943 RepID=H1Y3Y7_9SPHI|nr:helix-turn-helix transcriptional regulator [Mucilaginibacter paludis]EHQ30932.1 helix-turn-helix domain protein [Mucilaginibacter paludis DSM 18603]